MDQQTTQQAQLHLMTANNNNNKRAKNARHRQM
jgi:hypothetical protein